MEPLGSCPAMSVHVVVLEYLSSYSRRPSFYYTAVVNMDIDLRLLSVDVCERTKKADRS